jgi:hypothetical protein
MKKPIYNIEVEEGKPLWRLIESAFIDTLEEDLDMSGIEDRSFDFIDGARAMLKNLHEHLK